jgi:hypothetical protein
MSNSTCGEASMYRVMSDDGVASHRFMVSGLATRKECSKREGLATAARMKGYLIAVAVHVADLATSLARKCTCPTIRFASQEEVPKSRKLDYSEYSV